MKEAERSKNAEIKKAQKKKMSKLRRCFLSFFCCCFGSQTRVEKAVLEIPTLSTHSSFMTMT